MESLASIDEITLASELRAIGIDDRAYRRSATRGQIARVHRGAYVDAALWSSLDSDSRYRCRVLAAAMASRSRPTVSHASAAALWGVPLIGRAPSSIHVLASVAAGTRTEGAFRRHASVVPDLDVIERDGIRLTGFERTLVEFAAVESFASAVVAVDWALAPTVARRPKPVTTTVRLMEMADALGMVRARPRINRAIDFGDGRSGSAGESLSRAQAHELGFPAPELQVAFRDAHGLIGLGDYWWREYNLIGEFDGKAKYTRDEYTNGRQPAEIVLAEKKREDRLRALGHRVTRWDWETASDSRLLFAHLTAAGLPSWRRGRARA